MTGESHADRLGVVADSDRGTSLEAWSAWTRPFPVLDLSDWQDVLVVAPHPDDEILGVGGLMARLRTLGADVVVAAVTDGGAAYPSSPTIRPEELAVVRTLESEAACAALGIDPPLRLGLQDGAVAAREDELADRLSDLLQPGTHCLATWSGDGHPDHEAVGRAAALACRRRGAVLVEYPVWTWHWAVPDDPAVPWDRGRVLGLSAREVSDKGEAVGLFVSQVLPLSDDPADAAVLPPFVIQRLVRDREMVLL